MKVLFIGDSITRGTQGVSWVKMIQDDYPYWTIKNAGVNGETLTKISARLKKLIKADNSYKLIVLQTATSDILLPTLKHKNFWSQQTYLRQIKSSNIPAFPLDFQYQLKRLVEYILENTGADIILTTLGCINENLVSETNAELFSYNTIIRKIAKEYNCILADVSERFHQELSHRKTTDYCLDNFSNTAFLDLLSCSIGRADDLSNKRNLHLTIDGVHLNTKGATIFKEEVCKSLLLTKEKSGLFI